jgi:hypothetical protein
MQFVAKNAVPLGNVLESSLGAGLANRFAVTSGILRLWPAILPRHLSENCRPTMLEGGILTIEVLSPSHHFDLRWSSPCILRRLRQEFGNKVRRLSIVLADCPAMNSG